MASEGAVITQRKKPPLELPSKVTTFSQTRNQHKFDA